MSAWSDLTLIFELFTHVYWVFEVLSRWYMSCSHMYIERLKCSHADIWAVHTRMLSVWSILTLIFELFTHIYWLFEVWVMLVCSLGWVDFFTICNFDFAEVPKVCKCETEYHIQNSELWDNIFSSPIYVGIKKNNKKIWAAVFSSFFLRWVGGMFHLLKQEFLYIFHSNTFPLWYHLKLPHSATKRVLISVSPIPCAFFTKHLTTEVCNM